MEGPLNQEIKPRFKGVGWGGAFLPARLVKPKTCMTVSEIKEPLALPQSLHFSFLIYGRKLVLALLVSRSHSDP